MTKKYNIGIFHYIANFTDGVSLEMNKWKRVFEDMGHNVYLCAGKYGSADESIIEEMYHHRPSDDGEFDNHSDFALEDAPSSARHAVPTVEFSSRASSAHFQR